MYFLIIILLTQLPSEQTYMDIQRMTDVNYSTNDRYVDRTEQYFSESKYWDNPYWTDSWGNFCKWITEMFSHEANYDKFYSYMSSDYFVSFFNDLNRNKSNESEQHRFYSELRTTVNAPLGNGWGLLIALFIYVVVKKRLWKHNKINLI